MSTWKTTRPARTLLLLGAFALVAAACGGDDQPDDAGEPTTEDAAPSDEEDPADEDASDGDEDPDSPDDAEDAAGEDDGQDAGGTANLEEALEVLRRAERQPQQVTYDVEGIDEIDTATMTLAQDPPRSAMLMETAEGSFHVISDAERSVSCFDEGGAWQCFAGPAGDDPTEDFMSLPDADDLDLEDGEEPDRIERATILGRDAICLFFDEQDGVTDVEACFDTESGAFLRMRGTEAGATFSMEATAVSSPESRLFDPPAEPMEMQF